MAASFLILGGAKSGKSDLALALAESLGGRPVFLATARAGDPEMAQRIARHQARRGPAWQTVEEPLDLVPALEKHDALDAVLLVDCLTLWLSNLLAGEAMTPDQAAGRVEALAALIPRLSADLILVANEVGLGIVPHNPLARAFRDLAGSCNQRLAQAAATVVLVTAGLPLALKGALPPQFT